MADVVADDKVVLPDAVKVEQEEKKTLGKINANGHEYVDLGLPSGTLWETCNVGANSPEEYGDYFAWGEIELIMLLLKLRKQMRATKNIF